MFRRNQDDDQEFELLLCKVQSLCITTFKKWETVLSVFLLELPF